MFFDIETTTLGAYDYDAKVVLAQTLRDGELTLLPLWKMSEQDLIIKLSEIFYSLDDYEPILTYNGGFDFRYITNRISKVIGVGKSRIESRFRTKIKHIDMFQYSQGFMVPLSTILKIYNIRQENSEYGCVMKQMYDLEEFNNIINHGVEDVELLKKLIDKESDFANGKVINLDSYLCWKYSNERKKRQSELRRKYGVKYEIPKKE